MRIAYFGGSFNPPHYGHFLAAAWALSGGFVDRVWMVPCLRHAFGKALAPYHARVAMCELGTRAFAQAIQVSTIEEELGGPLYTIDIIEALVERHPEVQFRLLVGTDILRESEHWKSFDRLCTLAPLLVAPRGGYAESSPLSIHIPEISSSTLRQMLLTHQDISEVVPPPVLDYIQEHGLYSTSTS